MKDKFLFAAFAALAMTACTSEEDMQVNPTAQTSPIQFTVSMDDAQTRAVWGGSNNYTLQWTAGDQMSLFHGMNLNNYGAVSTETSLANAENAIYKAAAGSSKSGLTFTTQSMIKRGDAIMVYPCDTTFNYKGSKLYVKIPTVQNGANILGKVPFISEGLIIKEFEEGNMVDGTAGYARNYNIKLKQIATLYTLGINYSGDEYKIIEALSNAGEIAPILTQKVTLNSDSKFNTELEVKVKNRGAKGNWNEIDEQNIWVNESYVDAENPNVQEGSLSYVYDEATSRKSAEFMILPLKSNFAGVTSDNIVVDTYYGQVVVNADTEGVMFDKEGNIIGGNTDTGIKDGSIEAAYNLIGKLSNNKNGEGSTFTGEQVGVHLTQSVAVDLNNLDMSKVHIKSDKQLHDILTVYNALGFTKAVDLTIDGDVNERFELSMDNVRTLQSALYYGKVKLLPCTTAGEKCTTIVLTAGEGKTSEDVPSIDFLASSSNNIDIALAATDTWTWNSSNNVLFSGKVNKLINEGTFNLDNGDVIANSHKVKNTKMVNNGAINVEGLVKQQMEMTNNGTITIAKGGEYRADNTTITNEATSVTVMGEIYNSGIFATSNSGEINNYGLIQNMEGGVNNMTYITKNQTTSVSFAKEWGDENKYGTIVLKNADDNISVSNATNVGFIKYEYRGGEYVTPAICKYNYIVIKNHDIKFTAAAPEIKFIEIVGETAIPVFTNPKDDRFVTLEGFILKGKANLQENNKLVTPAAYIEGTLYYGGLFTQTGGTQVPATTGTYYGDSTPNCLVKF